MREENENRKQHLYFSKKAAWHIKKTAFTGKPVTSFEQTK